MRYLAIGVVVIGLVGCGKDKDQAAGADGDKVKREQVVLKQLAADAYPTWARDHPTQTCPTSIDDLKEYLAGDVINDAWGTPRDWLCDGKGFTVRSAGPDRVLDTADDLKSWR